MRFFKIKKNSLLYINFIIIILSTILFLNFSQRVLANTDEMKDVLENIFLIRNKSILSGDFDSLQTIYATDVKFGKWAYEYEEKKAKYINNWAEKQGAEFIEIKPTIVVRKSKINESTSNFNILCSTEYKYRYNNDPEKINTSRIGTYHSLQLIKKDNAWIITREWYTDPFADSLSLENIKADTIKEYILSQEARDFSNIGERRSSAIEYAEKFCGAASKEEYGFKYNKEYRDFNPEGGDCANFASQILYEGGKFKKNYTWKYSKGDASAAWVNAGKFTYYMLNSGRASLIAKGSYEKVYKNSYKLMPGDFIAYEKKGDIMHVSTVTGADSKGYTLVTCHNTDRNNVPWDLGWSDKKMVFWLVRVHY